MHIIGSLDEFDKDIAARAMRVKEQCGWCFPEVQEIVACDALHAKVVIKCGFLTNMAKSGMSSILEKENMEWNLKEQTIASVGKEASGMGVMHVQFLVA